MKALFYTLTLLLFSLGAGAAEKPRDQIVPAGGVEVLPLAVVPDAAPPSGSDWALVPAILSASLAPEHAVSPLLRQTPLWLPVTGLYAIRAPPVLI